jgi:hypothetical protein
MKWRKVIMWNNGNEKDNNNMCNNNVNNMYYNVYTEMQIIMKIIIIMWIQLICENNSNIIIVIIMYV